jgi:hypothetical protein
MLTRVRALLAKAESTEFEAEVETFTAAAQSLMARHSIDVAMLAAESGGRPGTEGPQGRRLSIDAPYEVPKLMLLNVVASANRCRSIWNKKLGFATVLGFTPDLHAVEVLFTHHRVRTEHDRLGVTLVELHRHPARLRRTRAEHSDQIDGGPHVPGAPSPSSCASAVGSAEVGGAPALQSHWFDGD